MAKVNPTRSPRQEHLLSHLTPLTVDSRYVSWLPSAACACSAADGAWDPQSACQALAAADAPTPSHASRQPRLGCPHALARCVTGSLGRPADEVHCSTGP